MLNSTTDEGYGLEEFNYIHTTAYIPATVLLTLVILVGLVSNVLAFLFYTFRAAKSSFQCIISILSLNDFLTNLALIHDIVELGYFVDYRSDAVCKLFYVIKHWLVGNSMLIIVGIAFDRHRLVCHPFATQITIKIARFILLGVVIFSLSISVHYFATSGIDVLEFSRTNDTSFEAYHCSLSREPSLATVIDVFHFTDIAIHAFSICSLVVLYSLVIRKLIHSRHRMKSHNNAMFHKNATSDDSNEHTDQPVSSVHTDIDNDTVESYVHSHTDNHDKDTLAADIKDKSETKPKHHHHHRLSVVPHIKGPEVKLTIMAFVITVASVVSFVPYYVSMMVVEANIDGIRPLYTVGEIIARRFYILNSAVNPFIMMYFNGTFRQYVVDALCFICNKVRGS